MERPTCAHCGLPLRGRPPSDGAPRYCCLGCAMVARIPVDEAGQFPVNGALVTALATGFIAFNQILFALLSFLLRAEQKATLAERFAWLSWGTAWALGVVLAVLFWRNGARRWDVLLLVLAAALWLSALRNPPLDLVTTTAAVAILLAANTRGLWWPGRRKK